MRNASYRLAFSILVASGLCGGALAACSGDDPASAPAAPSGPDSSGADTSNGGFDATADTSTIDASPDASDASDASVAPTQTAWTTGFGGTAFDRADAIVFDGSGNAYVSGHFSGQLGIGTVDGGVVDGGALDGGGGAALVAKLDPNGNLLWVKQVGPFATGTSLQLDPAGNVFLGFGFTGTINVGGQDLVSAGAIDIAFVKLDAGSGNVLLAKRFGGAGSDVLNSLALSAGAIILGGHYSAAVDFGLGSHPNVGNSDGFILALDANGTPVFDKAFGGPLDDDAFDLAIDSTGNVVATGRMSGSIDFGGGPVVSSGSSDGYLVVYSSTGVFVRSQRWGGAGYDDGEGLAFDAANNLYVTGYFNGSLDFGGGAITSTTQGSAFVFSQGSNAAHRWSKALAGSDQSYPGFEKPLAVDGAGNVVLTGSYKATIDLGGGTLTSKGASDVYFVKLTTMGTHVWSKSYGGTGDDNGNGVALSAAGWAGLAGDFAGMGTFDSTVLTSAGLNDCFALTTK
jgi:hypothetical protein